MKNTISLKLNKDFRRLYSKGKRSPGAYVAVYVSENHLKDTNRIGLTVSTSLGHAVVRNRLKRLMRAAYTEIEPFIGTGYDFVFVARGRAVGSCEAQIRKDLRYSFHKLGLFKNEDKADK